MNDLKKRLTSCFLNVFPNIQQEEIPSASTTTLKDWDSVAHVTLLSSVAEEFGIDLEVEDFDELTSYAKIAESLEKKSGNA